jgi:hypothetical protein
MARRLLLSSLEGSGVAMQVRRAAADHGATAAPCALRAKP